MDKNEWNSQVSHPLQSWEWGEFRIKRQPVSRLAGMQIMWTRVPYTPWYFGYIPMGRIPNEKEIEQLRDEAIKMNAIGIRMEPNIPREQITNFQFSILNQFFKPGRKLFKDKTILIDLSKTEEELLKNMHPKGRYNVRVALKHGVTVREDNSDGAFEKYLELMFAGTAKRQKIYSHGRSYHRLMRECLKNNIAHLWVAEYKNEIITADIIFKFKEGIYYAYGASKLEYKEVMAPTLLLWEIMKWGKNTGAKFFDLWGAEEGKGFSRFKEQFGGMVVEMAGTYDLPVNKWLYPLFRAAEGIRWKMLRILK